VGKPVSDHYTSWWAGVIAAVLKPGKLSVCISHRGEQFSLSYLTINLGCTVSMFLSYHERSAFSLKLLLGEVLDNRKYSDITANVGKFIAAEQGFKIARMLI